MSRSINQFSSWEEVKWAEVLTIRNGKNQKAVANPEGVYPIYGSGGVMGYADDYLCEPGTTIIGRKGSINNPIFVDHKFWNVDTAFGLCPGDRLNPKFFYYYCTTYNFLKHNKATTLPSLTKADLLKIELLLPPLDEQKKIAAIMDAADELRQKDKALIAKIDELAQALFLDMFGDPETNPKKWKTEPADKHIDLLTGFAFRSSDYSSNGEGVPLCGGLIITPDGIEWDKANRLKTSNHNISSRYWVKNGDIVMAMDRPWISAGFKLYKIASYDGESLLVQRTARIRGVDIDQSFLYYSYLNQSFKRHAKTTETTVPHISPKDIRSYPLMIPPTQLQAKFSSRVEAITSQRYNAREANQKSENLFNSLLQKAFKGELTN